MQRTVAVLATAVVLAVGVFLVGSEGHDVEGAKDPATVVAAGIGLQTFDACDDLQDHLVTQASVVGPWGWGIGDDLAAPTTAATDGGGEQAASGGDAALREAVSPVAGTSDTNVQVAGVDEPDLVETDGRRLFTVIDGSLQVVDVSGETPQVLATVSLGAADLWEGQLLLHGDRLLVLGSTWGDGPRVLPDRFGPAGEHSTSLTRLWLFDVGPDTPALLAQADLEGTLVTGRGVDGTVHLVIAHRPQPLPMAVLDGVWQAGAPEEMSKRLADGLADTSIHDWLPAMAHTDATGVVAVAPTVDCAQVHRTDEVRDTAMLQVVTLEATGDDLVPEGTTAVLTDATTVTATADAMVVATPVWPDENPGGPMPVDPGIGGGADVVAPAPGRMTTRLHLFDLAADGATYRASGEIDGQPLNQFSLSVHDGRIRAATTVEDWNRGTSESGITILERRGDRLETVGAVGGLGVGERIYAVRFLGDRAYVVTFRQIDPLYTVDLSDPAAPTVTGELKIPGYSAYLHPLPDDKLLGVGQEATLEGMVTGTQVSLFDVADPADPQRLAQLVIPNAGSEAEYDHHAFLYLEGTLVLPYERWGVATEENPEGYGNGAAVVTIEDRTLDLRGLVRQATDRPDEIWNTAIRRGVIVEGTLYTVSHRGVESFHLGTLESLGRAEW